MSLARFSRLPLRASPRQFSVLAPRYADKSDLDANKPGSVGREFESDGKIGGKAQEVGGPFAADGAVGKEFTKQGTIGGKAQEVAKEDGSVFDKDGAVGKEFDKGGRIAELGEKIGGPFASDGAIGKHFTGQGKVGGNVQEKVADENKK